jgi:hypothetical protein
MKIEQQRRKLGSDYTEILDYQIEASSKAFEILFKNIYSDPIKAVLRELGCNAYDSHLEAKRGMVPFDIHLPTNLDPCFYIRDYGVGLDGDEIRNIYRVVFKSTKTSSNEQIGCFGLGCKTPFSYTDNYIIESYKGGKKWICNAFYGDTAKPSLAFTVDGADTTEPDGLKVVIICKNDFTAWADKAREVYRFFTTKPNILGNKIDFPKITYVMEGPDWGLRSYSGDSWNSSGRGIVALMGQIPYRIEVHSISTLSSQEIRLANCGIDIKFNIGDLAVEANREGVHLNERSINAIKSKLSTIALELQKQVEKDIAGETCLWDASVKFHKITSSMNNAASIIDSSNIKFNGKNLLRVFTISDHHKTKLSISTVDPYYKKLPRLYTRTRIEPQESIFFLKDDTAAESRIKQYMITNNISSNSSIAMYVLENLDNGLGEKTTGVEDLFSILDIPIDRLIPLSTLPKVPAVKRTYNRAKTSKVNVIEKGSWKDAAIDLKDGQGFYVEMFQQHTICKIRNKLSKPTLPITDYAVDAAVRPRYEIRKFSLNELLKLQNYLDSLGFPVYTIYGIRSSHIPKLGPRWTNFYQYAQSKLGYILDLHQYEKKSPVHFPSSSVFSKQYCLKQIIRKVDKTTPFAKLSDYLDVKCRKIRVEPELRAYCDLFHKVPDIKQVSYQDEVDKIVHKYYLLSKIAPWGISGFEEPRFIDECVKYINSLGEKA